MLATLPQVAGQEDQAPDYDREARSPLLATLMGFALLAVLCHVIFVGGHQVKRAVADAPPIIAAAEKMPKRVLEAMAKRGWIEQGVVDTDAAPLRAADDGTALYTWDTAGNRVAIDLPDDWQDQLQQMIGNIDMVGLSLFEQHTLGIELAGVILLLSMVGAIVIGRRRVAGGEPDRPGEAVFTADDPASDLGAGEPAG
jgi:hypothetical protein